MDTDVDSTKAIRAIRIVFAGDRIRALFRSTDCEAVDRGEKVFLEVFQEAHDFAATFELPGDSSALCFLLESQSFCQLHEVFHRIACEPLAGPSRTFFAHDGVFGVLGSPDEWETARLPEDWPGGVGADGDTEGFSEPLEMRDGAAASGPCVVEALVTLSDNSRQAWHPLAAAPIQALLEHWPALRLSLRGERRRD